ncbi:DNA-binding domain-containing protein [Croceicoccus sp. YJ47]|uniref:HvfC/BufC N-terminal domain-containing protein n=1 Tax=Croceicoccus sp. YJ47 TaxID=2798724 RepID=UPI00192047ED|nr:DNA-binding domain-containing protein [Croceicoccus sp. YJ47]QQN74907.1 putative DNA-binding domain-containing protein [Croceicoccus sp. YJ47]
MSLRERQSRFLLELTEQAATSEPGDRQRDMRMDIYRNNYRSAVIEALESAFERTARLAGRNAFRQAAIHHVIEHPPTSWTLDLVGEHFPRTCRSLFAADPDVAEIAWLEWAMARAFTSRDASVMTFERFAAGTALYDEDGWANLGLKFLPGTEIATTNFDLPQLWRSLQPDEQGAALHRLVEAASIVVWREAETPVFKSLSGEEGRCLEKMIAGKRFEKICAWLGRRHDKDEAAHRAGSMLRHWLDLGLVEGIVREG